MANSTLETQPGQNEIIEQLQSIYTSLKFDSYLVAGLLFLVILRQLVKIIADTLEEKLTTPANYNRDVLAIANQLLEAAECDRVVVALFKNGEKYLNGWCHLRMKITHEVVRPQTSRINKLIGEVDVMKFAEELELYRQNQNLFYLVMADDRRLPMDCRAHLERIGASAMANHLIVRKDQEIGILSLQYCHGQVLDDNNENLIKQRESALFDLINQPRVVRLVNQMRGIIRNDHQNPYLKTWQMFKRKLLA